MNILNYLKQFPTFFLFVIDNKKNTSNNVPYQLLFYLFFEVLYVFEEYLSNATKLPINTEFKTLKCIILYDTNLDLQFKNLKKFGMYKFGK